VLRALVDGLDVGVANVSPNVIIQYANARFAEVLGVRPFESLRGSNLKDYISGASWESLDLALAQALHYPLDGEMKVDVGGKTRVVRLSLAAIRTEYRFNGISIVAHEVTELVETSKALHDSEASVHSLSGRILHVQDEERRRIARELHDITGQELAVVAISLDQLAANVGRADVDIVKGIKESVELVHKIEDEVRTLSYLLHPPLLDQLGLGAALRWYAEGFTKRTGIQVEVETAKKSPRFSADKETALFRIVQESLTNVLRHSGSRTALLRFSAHSGTAQVSIEDQGKGMDIQKLAANSGQTLGVGIGGMRERLRQLGGKLEIHSQPGGTRVVATLPVEECVLTREEADSGEEVSREKPKGVSGETATRKRILIADDHDVTRRGIRSLLEDEPDLEVCGEASDGLEAVAKARELQPDLVILDLIMPRAGGFAAAHKIRQCGIPTSILVFTTHTHSGLERMLSMAGCDGCVLKGNASNELVRGVRAVLAGKSYFNPES